MEGSKSLALAVRVLNDLSEINLSNCQIPDDGAKALFESLKQFKNLRSVILDQNPIGEGCLESCFEFLETTKAHVSLKDIALDKNLH